MSNKLKKVINKVTHYCNEGYAVLKSDPKIPTLMFGAGTVGGFLFNDRWMIVLCVAGVATYFLVTKKLKK